MRTGAPAQRRAAWSTIVGAAVLLALTACTGRGGGQLPADAVHDGSASFGFSFSCEDQGGLNPQTGRLRIQLTYAERGTQPLLLPPVTPLGSPELLSPFAIHGVADELDPAVESMFCSGQDPVPTGELIFLGPYRTTSTSGGFPEECSGATSSCRFEVIVRDGDGNRAPSAGDFFSIRLSTAADVTSDLEPTSVFYARAGVLSSGNVTVD